MKRLLLLFTALACVLSGADDEKRKFYVHRVLTGTVASITVQQGTRALKFDGAFVKSGVEFDYRLSKNATVTGGSTLAAQKRDDRATAFTGTVLADATIEAATTVIAETDVTGGRTLGDSGLRLEPQSGVSKDITITVTPGSSSTIEIYLEFSEP